MNKSKKISLIVVCCLFAVFASFALLWQFGDSYASFYNNAQKGFEIAGLNEGFTPQGLAYHSPSKTFLYSGYMNDGSASRIYVYDVESQTHMKHFTLKVNEEDYVGHAGGVATDGTSVWVCGDGLVHRFLFSDIATVENGGAINIVDTFESRNGADFVSYAKDLLIVGEFHRDGSHETDEAHHFSNNQVENKALTFVYSVNKSQPYGLTSTTPILALSTPSLAQGISLTSNYIALSTSYSLSNSKIYIYENKLVSRAVMEIDGKTVPVVFLQDCKLLDTIEAPCMCEGIVMIYDTYYFLFESACQKYAPFTREQLKNVYSYKYKI